MMRDALRHRDTWIALAVALIVYLGLTLAQAQCQALWSLLSGWLR